MNAGIHFKMEKSYFFWFFSQQVKFCILVLSQSSLFHHYINIINLIFRGNQDFSLREVVEKKLEEIRSMLVHMSSKELLNTSIQLSALKLIDKCLSGEHSILMKAKNIYLCITKTTLPVDVNYIKDVLQEGNINEKDKEDFQKHARNIEEECCQFEKSNSITARKRSQHLVESSGI